MITVNEFIKGYEKADDKYEYCSEHVTFEYVPYSKKIDKCQKIVKATCYKNVNGEEVFYINRPAINMLHYILELQLYTDIIIDNGVECFEKLDSCGIQDETKLLTVLRSVYPRSEISDLADILQSMIDDAKENTHDIVSFLDTKLRALNLSVDSLLEALGGVENGQIRSESGDAEKGISVSD